MNRTVNSYFFPFQIGNSKIVCKMLVSPLASSLSGNGSCVGSGAVIIGITAPNGWLCADSRFLVGDIRESALPNNSGNSIDGKSIVKL